MDKSRLTWTPDSSGRLSHRCTQLYQACWKPHSASLICSNPLKFMLEKDWTTQIQKSHVHEHDKCTAPPTEPISVTFVSVHFLYKISGIFINDVFISCDGKLRVNLSLSEDNVLVAQIKDSCPNTQDWF